MFSRSLKLSLMAIPVLMLSTMAQAQIVPVKDYRHSKADKNTATTQPAKQKTFNVIMEAPLPEGFPGPGPVGKVIEKNYPASRIAVADMKNGNPFFRLFRHIQSNKVAMTTPVEMEMSRNEAGNRYQMDSMGFYYESADQGKAGKDKSVNVEDHPKMRVVSIGMVGSVNNKAVDLNKKLIELYLKENKLEASSSYRIMGYNSPSVPNARKFFELQVEVKPVVAKVDKAEDKS